MALEIDYTSIPNWQTVTHEEAGPTAPNSIPMVEGHYKEGWPREWKFAKLKATTNAIALLTMIIGPLNEKTVEKWIKRAKLWEYCGGTLVYENRENYTIPRYLDTATIRAHIGIKANVPSVTDREFQEKLMSLLLENIERLTAPQYFVLHTWGDVEPHLHGPVDGEDGQVEKARKLRARKENHEDTMYRVKAYGPVEIEPFTGVELDEEES